MEEGLDCSADLGRRLRGAALGAGFARFGIAVIGEIQSGGARKRLFQDALPSSRSVLIFAASPDRILACIPGVPLLLDVPLAEGLVVIRERLEAAGYHCRPLLDERIPLPRLAAEAGLPEVRTLRRRLPRHAVGLLPACLVQRRLRQFHSQLPRRPGAPVLAFVNDTVFYLRRQSDRLVSRMNAATASVTAL